MKRQILAPNPFSVVDSANERNTDCIAERVGFTTGKGGAQGFGEFMDNSGYGIDSIQAEYSSSRSGSSGAAQHQPVAKFN